MNTYIKNKALSYAIFTLHRNKEKREENINACKQHQDVAYQVHVFYFFKIIEYNSQKIKNSPQNQHTQASHRKRIVQMSHCQKSGEPGN